MKRKSSNSGTLISAMTTPELFSDAPFNLVSETIAGAKAVAPVIQPQLFAISEILSFPPTKLDSHNRDLASSERDAA